MTKDNLDKAITANVPFKKQIVLLQDIFLLLDGAETEFVILCSILLLSKILVYSIAKHKNGNSMMIYLSSLQKNRNYLFSLSK